MTDESQNAGDAPGWLEWLPAAAAIIDAEGRISAWNSLFAARADPRGGDLRGVPISNLFDPGGAILDAVRATAADGANSAAVTARATAGGAASSAAATPPERQESGEALPGPGAGAGVVVDVVIGVSGVQLGGRRVALLLDAGAREAARAEADRLQEAVARSESRALRADAARRELARPEGMPEIVGRSGPLLALMARLERVAASPATVLIHGESGSGKELVARAVHARSPRGGGAWVAVNCAAMPESLLESELFGHERGAFTGADRQRLGKFELADGGTLFLDEIAELSAAAQAKLLRVLQDGSLVRVGGSELVRVDVRLVAATHRDLGAAVRQGRFREDLFYRLNVFRLDVPALRDRPEDIPLLAEAFHRRHAQRLGRRELAISGRSLRRLQSYRWPGNVRELDNAIERATLLASDADGELDVELPESPIPAASGEAARSRDHDPASVPRDVLLDLTADQLQRLQIMHALETRRYRVYGEGGAAGALGLKPQTLLSRMDKLGIPRPRAMRRAIREGG